jgi:SAM-dependent methyltransferase
MIELLSEEKLRCPEYIRIQNSFREIWDWLFWNRYCLDPFLLRRFGKVRIFGMPLSRIRTRNIWILSWIMSKLHPKMGKVYLDSDDILAGSQLAMGRLWEYPWAILNSDISTETKILDIGSGVSLFPFYLARYSNHVDSMDANAYHMKVIAPLLASMLQVKVNYFVGDATHLSAEDNTYDYVFCISVLEHLEQTMENGILVNKHPAKLDRAAIREFLRVIKPGGKVILTLDYGNDNLCRDWIRCFFNFDYIRDLIEDFRDNLMQPFSDYDEIKLTADRESQLIELWSEYYPYLSKDQRRFGTALGIILTK